MYRTGQSSVLDFIMGATTFEEFATNWDLLEKLNDNDASLVQQTKDLRAEVQEQQAASPSSSALPTRRPTRQSAPSTRRRERYPPCRLRTTA